MNHPATQKTTACEKESTAKPRKKRWGDRSDGRRLRTVNPMTTIMPFIMPQRCDALNYFADKIDITNAEEFLREQKAMGNISMGMLHIFLAAYVRIVSQRPAINRFVSGQRIYARNNIEVVMTIKKELSTSSPDTVVKCIFEPTDTLLDVYQKFNKIVEENNNMEANSDFDKTMGVLAKIPRFLLRFAVKLLNWMDYHRILPKFLLKISPFHGSFIITSMGSLGIQPIYHHIYNFGNLPIFFAYGAKRKEQYIDDDGEAKIRPVIDFTVVTDERICDGYYYAAAFKLMRRYLKNPSMLMTPPETVYEDID
ncbi:MAG: 2-oxo acid dehydrogenase subunit E2 [Eubacteriales bacterium]|nr:2-oxo acid dehydrogenase subunit E2 [Eubacteriales bacterium]